MEKNKVCPKCGEELNHNYCDNCKKKYGRSKKVWLILLILLVSMSVLGISIFLIVRSIKSNGETDGGNKAVETKTVTAKDRYAANVKKMLPYNTEVKEVIEIGENKYDLYLVAEVYGSGADKCISKIGDVMRYIKSSTMTNNISLECNYEETSTTVIVENFSENPKENYTYIIEIPGQDSYITSDAQIAEAKKIEYKNSCTSVNYRDALRYPDKYKGTHAKWFGEIVQVVSKSKSYSEFRISVDCTPYQYIGGYNCENTLYVVYYGDESFIEDDMVNMWGTMQGNYTYTTVMNSSLTIPKFDAAYMELVE